MTRKGRTLILVLGLTSGLILTTLIAAYYYWLYLQAETAYQDLLRTLRGVRYSANVLFDFGNSTHVWFNDTRVPIGWNLFNLTLYLTQGRVTAVYYSQYQSHFVTGIEGVQNTQNKFWFLWVYETTTAWRLSPVGADQLTISDGSIYAWTFCATSTSDQPSCHP